MTAHNLTDHATRLGDMLRLGVAIADRAVVADIEALPVEPSAAGAIINGRLVAWRDTRAMLNPNEHAPAVLDMAAQALAYAEHRRLIARHPSTHHLVRITARAD